MINDYIIVTHQIQLRNDVIASQTLHVVMVKGASNRSVPEAHLKLKQKWALTVKNQQPATCQLGHRPLEVRREGSGCSKAVGLTCLRVTERLKSFSSAAGRPLVATNPPDKLRSVNNKCSMEGL